MFKKTKPMKTKWLDLPLNDDTEFLEARKIPIGYEGAKISFLNKGEKINIDFQVFSSIKGKFVIVEKLKKNKFDEISFEN